MQQASKSDTLVAYAIAGVSLWLSYVALADLARRSGIGEQQAYAWPLIVDGLILFATRSVFTFGTHPARRYAWTLLWAAATLSVLGNAAHILLPDGPVMPAIAVTVGITPPVVTLAITHLVMVRARVRREQEADAALEELLAAPETPQPDPGRGSRTSDANAAPPKEAPTAPIPFVSGALRPQDAAPDAAPAAPHAAPVGETVPHPDAAPAAPAAQVRHSQVKTGAAPRRTPDAAPWTPGEDAPAPIPFRPRAAPAPQSDAAPAAPAPQPRRTPTAAPAATPNEDTREDVLRRLEAGESARAIARDTGISDRTIRRWKNERDAELTAAVS